MQHTGKVSMKKVCIVAALAAALGILLLRTSRAAGDLLFAYYPGLHQLDVRVEGGATGHAEIWKSDGKAPIATSPLASGNATIPLPAMPDGDYELRVFAPDGAAPQVRRFQHQNFPWLDNTLGESDAVYPPYTPIQTDRNKASVVLRQYTLNGFGLWDSVISDSRELLAAPIALHAQTSAGELPWQFGPASWTRSAPNAATWEADARCSALHLHTTSTIEYDGCMKVEMDLLPSPEHTPLNQLVLDIPLRDAVAPLFHYTAFEGMRWNYAGDMPRGGRISWDLQPPHWSPPLWSATPGPDDGILWTCRDIRPERHVIPSDFVPYIWIGGGERGIAFFGENDKGYSLDPAGIAQSIERKGNTLFLHVALINRPGDITTPRHITFGLQASPTRPMPPDWRQSRRIPSIPGPDRGWGCYICADKYPPGKNFAIADAMKNIRNTGNINYAHIGKIDRERPEPWKTPDGRGGPWVDGNLNFFLTLAQRNRAAIGPSGQAFPFTFNERFFNNVLLNYFEEHMSDITTDEWQVFQDEWRNDSPRQARDQLTDHMQPKNQFPSGQNLPCSYQDFCLYYANEWMTRGAGIYFDNVMPFAEYNPRTSDAFVDDRNILHPACPLWEQRRYYQRAWIRMMELIAQKASPYPLAMVFHQTNARILPLSTWPDASVDIEWTWNHLEKTARTADGQEINPFPADLLLAETAGRQSGAIPHALHPVTGIDIKDNKVSPLTARCEWGLRAVHEILPIYPFSDLPAFRALENICANFGYGSPDIAVYNYWDDQPALATSQTDVKWLLLANPRTHALLIVLQSWNTAPLDATLTLDPNRFGFIPANGAADAENDAPIPFDGRQLRIPLPGPYGTRIIRIGPK